MTLNPKFYYNSEEGSGGGAPAAEPPIQEQGILALPEDVAKELEELRAFKKSIAEKPPEKTPEELAKESDIEKAELIKFSTENDLMKVDDFTKLESLKAKDDRDLVFEGYLKDWKEENPDADPNEMLEMAKRDFEAEYKLDSENEKTKARGLAKLAKEASTIRSPFETTFQKAKEEFSRNKSIQNAMPKFNEFIDAQVSMISDKITLFTKKDGEDEINIEVELTKEDKEEISKTFKNHKTFYDFQKEKPDELKVKLEKKIKAFIREKKAEEVNTKIWEKAHEIGKTKGSNVGAANPFPLIKDKHHEFKPSTIDESTAKAVAARERLGR